VETNVSGDESNARRLRDQRRYFGVADIEKAQAFGYRAKEKTKELPRTAVPCLHIVRGWAGRSKVRTGFMHSWRWRMGVIWRKLWCRWVWPGHLGYPGTPGRDYGGGVGREPQRPRTAGQQTRRGHLGHYRLESIAEERRQLRAEEAELERVQAPAKLKEGMKIDLNTAARDELLQLPGVGDVTAIAIIEHRPYTSIDSLLRVPNIGPSKFEKLRPFLRIESTSTSRP